MLRVSPQRKMDEHVRKLRKLKGVKERALWYPRDSQRRDKLLNSQEGSKAEFLNAQFNYYRQFPSTPGLFDEQFNQANFVAAGLDASQFFSQASTRQTDRQAREAEDRAYDPPAPPPPTAPPAPRDPTVQSRAEVVESTRFFSREASRRAQEEELAQDQDLQRTHRGN